MLLNYMPYLRGISENFSPRELVTVRGLDFNKHCKARLGSYVEANEDIVVTNIQHPQTYPGIY